MPRNPQHRLLPVKGTHADRRAGCYSLTADDDAAADESPPAAPSQGASVLRCRRRSSRHRAPGVIRRRCPVARLGLQIFQNRPIYAASRMSQLRKSSSAASQPPSVVGPVSSQLRSRASRSRASVRVQPEEPVSSFAPIREHVERLNVGGRKTSTIERGVRYECFHETRLFVRILRNVRRIGGLREF